MSINALWKDKYKDNSSTLGKRDGIVFVTAGKWGKESYHYVVRMNGEIVREIHDFKTLDKCKATAELWLLRNVNEMHESTKKLLGY